MNGWTHGVRAAAEPSFLDSLRRLILHALGHGRCQGRQLAAPGSIEGAVSARLYLARNLVFQGRYGIPGWKLAFWNWPYALVMLVVGCLWLQLVARVFPG